jgi:DNA mismatch repair protein MutS2
MIDPAVLEILEFPKILQYASKYCYTELGKEDLLSLLPKDEMSLAVLEGAYVNEAKNILIDNASPPIEYIPDLRHALSSSRVQGAVLDNKTIYNIYTLAVISRKTAQFLKSLESAQLLRTDFLCSLISDKKFENSISTVLDENGEVKESASAELRTIRIEIRQKEEQLRKVVNRILKELSDSYLVREEYFTQRDGRLVIPVKAEHKRHVRGFIHSESSTGQTVYIEPEATLELNNDILSLYFAEKREIERILKLLTKSIGEYSFELRNSLQAIARLDSFFARAKYSVEIIGSFPSFTENNGSMLLDARHPVLIRKIGRNNTVPLNIKLGQNITLITGPNAGGKTVVLKTIGLLVCMAEAGFHIPAGPDSCLRFFNQILLDIGDRQSIEDDLSTFSSHLSNIKDMILKADNRSLILLDEIGTGTDPAEGAALATATLITLRDKKSSTLATTHHGSLKMLANDMQGFENASMLFDTERLVPTYIFRQGTPGSSYAFEVAERIGFTKDFLALANNYLDVDKSKVENLLIDLEKKSSLLENKLRKMEIENSRLTGLSNLYQQSLEKIKTQKKDIIEESKKNADLYLRNINKKIEAAIKEIKENKADKSSIKNAQRLVEELKRENLSAQKDKIAEQPHLWKSGDYVELKGTGTVGMITELYPEKKKALVLAGTIKMFVSLDEIGLSSKKTEKAYYQTIKNEYSSLPSAQLFRLDIRGRKPEEAEFDVIKFLDDSYSSNMTQVEILHGKGTGVLKKMVHDILKKHEAVNNYYFAKIEFGGEGITIVELK